MTAIPVPEGWPDSAVRRKASPGTLGSEMSVDPKPTGPPKRTPEGNVTREEYLSRGRPLPPMEEMVIEDLTPEEAKAFLEALRS